MKILTLIALLLFSFIIYNGCSSSTETKANGSITVQLTGAAEANGKNVFFSVWKGDVDFANIGTMTEAELMEAIEGGNLFTIADGTGESIAIEFDTFQPKIFSGGQKYSIVLFVDINESINLEDFDPTGLEPLPGDKVNAAPIVVTIDGQRTVVIKYADLFTIPGE